MNSKLPELPKAWSDSLRGEWLKISQNYSELLSAAQIRPPREQWFRAMASLRPEDVCVVILGQDPYHGLGQAEGLSFSVPIDQRIPPSLRNIFKELASEGEALGVDHGHLGEWVEQGVMLLNAALTVPLAKPGEHLPVWESFTDTIIRRLDTEAKGIVFMLWGSFAQSKAELINNPQHLILRAAHPSPLSAHRGFFGCDHFRQCNQWLQERGRTPINWQLRSLSPLLL